jgi:hypothetical protein
VTTISTDGSSKPPPFRAPAGATLQRLEDGIGALPWAPGIGKTTLLEDLVKLRDLGFTPMRQA